MTEREAWAEYIAGPEWTGKPSDIWRKAVEWEREACAQIADARAMRCEDMAQGYIGLDEDEVASLRSLAWQFSVLAAEMRKRSNKQN